MDASPLLRRTARRSARALAFGLSLAGAASAEPFRVTVSPRGPVASLEAARDAIREARSADPAALAEGAIVTVEAGTYPLERAFELGPEDSGAVGAPVVYEAAPGARPRFSAGARVAGWRSVGDGVWEAPLPAFFRDGSRGDAAAGSAKQPRLPNQLFVNDARRDRARTPNRDAGFLRMAGKVPEGSPDIDRHRAFVFAEADAARMPPDAALAPSDAEGNPVGESARGAEAIAIHSWETSRLPIAAIDRDSRTLRMHGQAHWAFGNWDGEQRYYLENFREALDGPGEWFADAARGVILYRPLPGENFGATNSPKAPEAIVPSGLETLVVLQGNVEEARLVEHVVLRGLVFEHAEWSMPATGYSPAQASWNLPAAVELRGVRRVTIEDCEIARVGGHALRVRRGSSHVRIVRAHLHDLGGGGAYLGETALPKEARDRVTDVVLRDSYLHHGGQVFESAVGVWIGQSSDDTIANNEISNFGYTGVSVGWTWGYADTDCHRNVVERNHIHHIGRGVLSDLGGIYTLGDQRGGILRENHIHHVITHRYAGWGVYHDEGTAFMTSERNVVHHTFSGGFHQHYGKENVLRNNVFADGLEGQVIRSRAEDHRSFRFEGNIVAYRTGRLLGSKWGDDRFFLERNVYWREDGEPPDFDGLELDEWRAEKGMDLESIIADPLFVNPPLDYRLREDSPARALGIESIDLSADGPTPAGLRGDGLPEAEAAAWRALPSKYPNFEQPWPEHETPTTPLGAVMEDFEGLEPGRPWPVVVTHGATGGPERGPSALVAEGAGTPRAGTSGDGTSGSRGLRFRDADGLPHAFDPHVYYDPGLTTGEAVASFRVRMGEGALLYHEWRDAASPYRAGPSIWLHPDGRLMASGREVARLPVGRWARIEARCKLGREATGTWSLAWSVEAEPGAAKGDAGREPGDATGGRADDLPCDPRFRRLRWIGWCSHADAATVLDLDDVRVTAE